MTGSDRNEIRKRFVKDNSISRLALCYVNSSREKVVIQNETFLNLPEEDMYKYLDIAKKSLSGNLGDNLMEFSYTSAQEEDENYRFLMGLRDSGLKNDDLLNILFDRIIDCYIYDGNFLITVICDSYDVPVKTTDKNKLDESEEVFSYIIVSICPVTQTKPGLGYNPATNRIGAREKDWVAGAPETAFMFPCFSDRMTDIHHVCFYSKDPSDLHEEIIDSVLGCSTKKTASQCRIVLRDAVVNSMPPENRETALEKVVLIHDSLQTMLDESGAEGEDVSEIILDKNTLTSAVKEVIKDEAYVNKIVDTCEEEFDREPPRTECFIDKKTLRATEGERREKELKQEIAELKSTIETTSDPDSVNILIPASRADSIRIENMDGERYVMIPLLGEETPNIRKI